MYDQYAPFLKAVNLHKPAILLTFNPSFLMCNHPDIVGWFSFFDFPGTASAKGMNDVTFF
jgi:hypothetical protein